MPVIDEMDEAREALRACLPVDIGMLAEDSAPILMRVSILKSIMPLAEAYAAARARRLADALPDPGKLELLADWFDVEQARQPERWSGDDVQADLRRWASLARAALERERALVGGES